MSSVSYSTADMEQVLTNLKLAEDKINLANEKLKNGYEKLNSITRSSLDKKIVVENVENEKKEAQEFYESVESSVQALENLTFELTGTPTLSNTSLNFGLQAPTEKTSDEQILASFEQFNLSDEQMAEVEGYLNDGNIDMVMLLYCTYLEEKNLTEMEASRTEKQTQLDQLILHRDNLDTERDNVFAIYDTYIGTGNYTYDSEIVETFVIADEEVTFHSYNEAIAYFAYDSETGIRATLDKKITLLEDEIATLNVDIRTSRKTYNQEMREIEFQNKYASYYKNPDLTAVATMSTILAFASESGADLKSCNITDIFLLAGSFISENPDVGFNWLAVIEFVRKENPNFQNLTTEEVVDVFQSEYLNWATFTVFEGTNSLNYLNQVLRDYKYMSQEEIRVFNYIYETEGEIAAFEYLGALEVRQYNAKIGAENGYIKFETIVNQPIFLDCITAYITGGVEGLISWFENNKSFFTGNYDMTINDYEIQTIQFLFDVIIESYADVDEEGLIRLRDNGFLDDEQFNTVMQMMEEGPVKYYDVLVVNGYITEEDASRIEGFMGEISGGKTYTGVLKNFHSAGVSSGNMAPSLLLSMIPTVGPTLGRLAMFTSCAGGTYRSEMRNGASYGEAMIAGFVDGGIEVECEKLLGGMFGLSINAPTLEQWASLPFAKKMLALFVVSPFQEMKEEVFQLYVGDFIQSLITGEPYKIDEQNSQFVDTLISTYISTVGSNAPIYGTSLVFEYNGAIIPIENTDIMRFVGPDGTFDSQGFLNELQVRSTQATDISFVNAQGETTNLQFEYKDGVAYLNGMELTNTEASNIAALIRKINSSEDTQTVDFKEINDILKFREFTPDERLKLDGMLPNWREQSVLDAMKLLDENNVIANLDRKTLSNIQELDRSNIPNVREMITAYISDTDFKNFLDSEYFKSYFHPSSDLAALAILKHNVGDDYQKMQNIYTLYNTDKYRSKTNGLQLVESLTNNPEYYEYYLNFLEHDSSMVSHFTIKREMLTPSILLEELKLYDNSIEGIHEYFKSIFPYMDGFLQLDSNRLGDGQGKYFQELFKVIMNSDNPEFVERAYSKILETFDIQNIDKAIKDSIAYYRTYGMHSGDLTNIETLRHETRNIDGQDVEVYYTDGQDVVFITHTIAVDPNDQFKTDRNKKTTKLYDNPAIWSDGSLPYNENLSLSTSFTRNGKANFTWTGPYSVQVILGFEGIPLDQIHHYRNNDAMTAMSGKIGFYGDFYTSFDTVQDFIDNPTFAYNEVLATRYLPNGEVRKPDFLITKNSQISDGSAIVKWANYYHIPIVVINDAPANNNVTTYNPFDDSFTADFFGITSESTEQTEVSHEAAIEQIESVLSEIAKDFPEEESGYAQDILTLYVLLNDSRFSDYYKNSLSEDTLQLFEKYKSRLQSIKVEDAIAYLSLESVVSVTGNQPTIVSSTINLSNTPNSENWNCLTMEENKYNGKIFQYGRDRIVKEINGYELKPDHVYRAMSVEEYDAIVKSGYVIGKGTVTDEYVEYEDSDGKIRTNNMGVDWYLGGVSAKYGEVIVECPATPQYFIPTSFQNMANDAHVKHMKSSGFVNPVPTSMIKLIQHPTIDVQLEGNVESLAAPVIEQDSKATGEIRGVSEYRVFESEKELPAHIFENEKYSSIIEKLADGYSLNEIYQLSSETKRGEIDSFIKILDENGLDIDMATALYNYTTGSNMILGIKRGTVSKNSVLDNIILESKERLTQREISQEMITTIDDFVRNLDYSLPLYKNYELVKDFFRNQGLSNSQITTILTSVKDINSLYHVDDTIAKLDEAISKCTLKEPTVLYRAVDSSYLKQYLKPGESLTELVGKTISETGYLSTSPLYDKSLTNQERLDLVFEIYAPEGTKGIDVTPFSGYEGAEVEYLLDPTNLYVFEVIPNVVDSSGQTKTICKCTTDKSLMEAMIAKQGSKTSLGQTEVVHVEDQSPTLAPSFDVLLKNIASKVSKIQLKNNILADSFGLATENFQELTDWQKSTVSKINDEITTQGSSKIVLDDTSKLSTSMLVKIKDLSKVEFTVYGGFNYLDGTLKPQYKTDPSYIDRVTYTGNEMLSIVGTIEQLQRQVDMSLPPAERAQQIYEILRDSTTYMRKYKASDQLKIGQSLRGITNFNQNGKAELVCAGYAQVYKELCERCGIECDYIRGIATNRFGMNLGNHAWNVVIPDSSDPSSYIPVDVTWGKFGMSKKFALEHKADNYEVFKDYNK